MQTKVNCGIKMCSKLTVVVATTLLILATNVFSAPQASSPIIINEVTSNVMEDISVNKVQEQTQNLVDSDDLKSKIDPVQPEERVSIILLITVEVTIKEN